MLKLKLQRFGYLMRRVDSLEKTLMLGGIGGRRRSRWQRMRWLDGITDSMDVSHIHTAQASRRNWVHTVVLHLVLHWGLRRAMHYMPLSSRTSSSKKSSRLIQMRPKSPEYSHPKQIHSMIRIVGWSGLWQCPQRDPCNVQVFGKTWKACAYAECWRLFMQQAYGLVRLSIVFASMPCKVGTNTRLG